MTYFQHISLEITSLELLDKSLFSLEYSSWVRPGPLLLLLRTVVYGATVPGINWRLSCWQQRSAQLEMSVNGTSLPLVVCLCRCGYPLSVLTEGRGRKEGAGEALICAV